MNTNRISLRQEVKTMKTDIKKLYELVTILALQVKKLENENNSEESNESNN